MSKESTDGILKMVKVKYYSAEHERKGMKPETEVVHGWEYDPVLKVLKLKRVLNGRLVTRAVVGECLWAREEG